MKNSSQWQISVLVSTIVAIVAIAAFLFQESLLAFWLIGITMGFVLYKSGICFASMFQDMILFRNFSMARAVLLLIIISLIGIDIFQIHSHVNGVTMPGRFQSFGVHTAVGGFVFGVGMILAGGCAVGTLQRIGEGFLLFWLVLLGIISGSLLGVFHYSWWVHSFYTHKPVFLPYVLGWMKAGFVALLVLGTMYCLTFLFENKTTQISKGCDAWYKKS